MPAAAFTPAMVMSSNLPAAVAWRSAAIKGAELGALTGLAAAAVDVASALGADFAGSRPGLVLYVLSLAVTSCSAAGVLLGSWMWAARRLVAGWPKRSSIWVISTCDAAPVMAVSLYAPSIWIGEHLRELDVKARAVSALVLLALTACAISGTRVAHALARRWSEERGRPRLEQAALIVLASAVGLGCYIADVTLYPGDYPEFHEGLAGAFVGAAAVCVALVRAMLLRRVPRTQARLRAGAVGLAALGVWSLVLLEQARIDVFGASRAVFFTKVVHRVRALSDFDGDGHAATFGGRDCTPFDARSFPGAMEIPENGIDEDCSGRDARWPVAPPAPRRSGVGKPNVLLITVDTLRADHLGTYGYDRPTSPNIDRLADESLVFLRAFSQSPKTWDSVASFLTGAYPSHLPRNYAHPRVRERKKYLYYLEHEIEPLAETFARHGYSTSAAVAVWLLGDMGLDRGFEFFERDSNPTAHAERLLAKARPPFLIWLHYKGPHEPYRRYSRYDFGKTDIDRYDSEIAAEDARIGKVLAALSASGFADSTIVILSADHGEEFGEHGGRFHGQKHYRELLHVPLIARIPGVKAARIGDVVELVDIVPTLHELCGLPTSRTRFDGQSLLDTLRGPRPAELGGAYSEAVSDSLVTQRAFFDGRYRFIHDLAQEREELYDVQVDPMEQRNLVSVHPDIAARLRERVSIRALRSRSPRRH